MISTKNIFKSTCKVMLKILRYLLSLIIIGIVAGITFFLAIDYKHKPQDEQFIKECMATGESLETCKGRVF